MDTMTRVLLLGLTLLLGFAEAGSPVDAASAFRPPATGAELGHVGEGGAAATSPAVSFLADETRRTSAALHAAGERDGPPDADEEANGGDQRAVVAGSPADADQRASERGGRSPATRAVVRALLGTRGRRLGGRRLAAPNCPHRTYAVKDVTCTKKSCSASVFATIPVPVFKGFSVKITYTYVYLCPCYTTACPTCMCGTSSCSGDCPEVCVFNGYNCVTCPPGTYMPYFSHTSSQCTTCPKGYYCPEGSSTPTPW